MKNEYKSTTKIIFLHHMTFFFDVIDVVLDEPMFKTNNVQKDIKGSQIISVYRDIPWHNYMLATTMALLSQLPEGPCSFSP
jgi:hypothetical protein